ncbi:Metabotropic glutamate receptor like protein [Argiope bruennichi]|uniref:Metabotropic glutamate receptor like protein n=1 Tax=Argiope bruennichi TaxID=94029 RepID=A0A8T0EUC9_ARGBR|nr:Metabotropic glutamate receptor like protein [Argiope bruennichi]
MAILSNRIFEVFVFLILWSAGACSIKDKSGLSLAYLDRPPKLVQSYTFERNEKRHSSFPLSLFRKRRVTGGLNYTWPIKRVAEINGDVILGGLMMIHEREDRRICGPIMPQGGIQALECMLYTMDWINNQKDFLPGFKLGAYVLDDCDKDTYGLEQAVDFIKGSISNIDDGTYRCPDGSSPTIRHKRISGVLGAASSVTSIQVANLLRLFKIPQVSFFSTSPELSNKQRFEYFLRTVPSDTNQVDAMVQIIQRLNWTYVSILYEESNYGIQAFTVLEELLSKIEICIAVKERLTKDSGVAGDSYYDNIVNKLMAKPSAKGVIIFGSDQEVAGVMRAIRRNNCTGLFSWIGSDGWSARSLVFDGHESQVEGTISVQPRAHPVEGFDTYFQSLTVYNNSRNPWFIEFWEHFFNCKWPGSSITPYNQFTKVLCTGEEVMSPETGYEAEKQLQFVSDSVMAFAHALKGLHADVCKGKPGICPKMDPIDGAVLLSYLKNVSFRGLSGDEFQFSENGDGPARYNIIHFKQISPGNYKWIRVGEYRDGELKLSLSDVRFRWEEPDMPISACSIPCGVGQAKKYVEGSKCCWHCFNCTKYQILRHETTCYDCPLGFLPNADHSECEEIPHQYMKLDSYWAIGIMIFSSLGIVITSFVIIVFIKHQDTPVVKASGRELSYVLLAGIFLCYAITFLLIQKPSDVKCGAQKMGIGLCFTIVYSAILTKTNRIDRIFRCGARSTKRPNFISPKSQLFICGGIVSIQVIFSAMWMGFSPPKAILYHPNPDESHLVCAASIDATYMVAFAYPMILILICTVYAILTRKIPEAFNESKYIGFTMYTTCIVWLAFIPLYFTTTDHDEINVFTMSVTVSLSATVTLFCLFTPKLYIILLHPDKNVRQPLMNHSKYVGNNDTRVTSSKAEPSNISEGSSEPNEVASKSSKPMEQVTCGTQTTSIAGINRCVSCTVISSLKNEENNMKL